MPDMIPVGDKIIPPDPMKGINTLSGIIGIQQQRQALQTGQYQQQTAQAGAQQAQQENREKQGLATFAQKAAEDPAYWNPDGSANVQKFQQGAMKIAPVYGQQYIGQMTSNFNGAVENRRSLLNLSNEQRQTIGNYFGAVAAKPGATDDDFMAAVKQARGVSSDPAYQDHVDRMLRAIPSVADMSTDQASNRIRGMARLVAQAANSPTAAQSNPNLASVQLPKNVLGLMETNPQAMGGAGEIKGGVVGGVAPAQQPGYLAQAATAQGGASGQVGTDKQVFEKVMASGANAQRGIELAKKIQQEAAGVRTGQYTQDFANRLTVLKQHDPNITDRQLLQKDAANLKTLAEEGATTDAERNQIGGGFPSPETMGPDAVAKAARYWEGSFHMAGARRDNAVAHVSSNGSIAGLTMNDSAFMRTASPGKFAPPEPTAKTVSMQDVQDYAQKHGLSVEAAKAHVLKNGFKIQ